MWRVQRLGALTLGCSMTSPTTVARPGRYRLGNCSSTTTTAITTTTSHAESVTVVTDSAADPGALVDRLEQPPHGVYRMKGTVAVGKRHYLVNVVGRFARVKTAPAGSRSSHLVAIGTDFDSDEVRACPRVALHPSSPKVAATGMRRLQRLRQLSI